jgi:plasmid maintenance system antidote protein VapI
METRKERFLSLIKHYDLTPPRFAKLVGISIGIIDMIKADKRSVSSKMCEKVVAKFPEVNLEWLELGKGKMLIKSYGQNTEQNTIQIAAEKAGYNPIHTTQDDGEEYPKIVTNAKTAFIKYYQQMNLISQLMQSKQEEYQEVYEHLVK